VDNEELRYEVGDKQFGVLKRTATSASQKLINEAKTKEGTTQPMGPNWLIVRS